MERSLQVMMAPDRRRCLNDMRELMDLDFAIFIVDLTMPILGLFRLDLILILEFSTVFLCFEERERQGEKERECLGLGLHKFLN